MCHSPGRCSNLPVINISQSELAMAATYKGVFVLALICSPLLIALAQKPNSADPSAVLRPLTPQQVAAFETRVTADPDDLEARSALLSFYFLHEMRQSPEVALKK